MYNSDNKRTIIAFIGPAGSGKTEAARFLQKVYSFERTRFAEPLKRMLKAGLGLSDEQVDGSEKEVPTDKLCGRTPRHAMKTLGTEWGRDLMHPDFWVEAWRNTLPNASRIVVDDMRFPNEHKIVKKRMKGTIIRIKRSGFDYDPTHPSEAHELEPDIVIYNPPELKIFHQRIADAVDKIILGIK